MLIRPATPDDAQAIAEVHVAAWRSAYAGLMPQNVLDALSVEQRAAGWHRTLSSPGSSMTSVASGEDGKVVGFALYGPSRDEDRVNGLTGELLAINLLPQVWRCGFGRSLCDQALSHAQDQGWQSLTLWVLRENAGARAFYESMGFELDGMEKTDTRLVGSPLNELRYRQQLSAVIR
ncbi:MAG: hypothetical protein JWL63_3573 [Rhodocyclales bacterium]|nr:hypothetical protein [Rhodocyclales bacterium]